MNILLIQPESLAGLKETRSSIPLSLLYLSSAVRTYGHTPSILDFSILNVPQSGIERSHYINETCSKTIESKNPMLIGITCFTTMHFHLVRELAVIIKEHYPDIILCIGGAHPTFFGEEILLNCDYIDYIITGEGEEALIGLASFIENKNGLHTNKIKPVPVIPNMPDSIQKITHLSSIPALIYRDKNNKIIQNQRKSYIKDISILNMPAWDMISFSDYYAKYDSFYNPKNLDFSLTIPVISSRSCPFSCTFCSAHLLMGKKYRRKTATQVVDEIEYLHLERGQNYFAFMDDVINIDKKHIIGICDEIIKRNLNIQISVNQGLYLASVVKEVVDALADAGMVTASMPIEHGDEYLRRNILKKKLSDEKIYEVASYLKNRDIFTIGLFIMGYPEETEDSLKKTETFIKDLSLDINGVSTLVPFPDTEVYYQAKKDDLLLINMDEIWKGSDCFDTQNREGFFIKPYNASIDTLHHYRTLFDSMYFYSNRAKKLNNIPIN